MWGFKLESKCGWVTDENTHDIVPDYNYANSKNAIALKIKNKIKVLEKFFQFFQLDYFALC